MVLTLPVVGIVIILVPAGGGAEKIGDVGGGEADEDNDEYYQEIHPPV
jgi:hypothetical protein